MTVLSDHPSQALLGEAVARYGDELRGFVAKRVPAGDVEDVVQSAFEKAAAKLGSLRDAQTIRAWLYRIVRNTIVDSQRRAGPPTLDLQTIEPARLASEVAAQPEGTQCCCALALIRSLPPGQAGVLQAVALDDATPSEAAQQLGISRGNADVRLHRARKTLKDRLEDHCGVTSIREAQSCTCDARECGVA